MSTAKILYRGVIQPWQCDSIGHFTTRFYMGMFDDATWHFLNEAGFDTRLMNDENIGWADVLHNIEYKRELHAGDLIIIEGWPLQIGGKSIKYQLEMKKIGSDDCCARFTATTVQFDLERRVAIPVISAVREKLQAWIG